MSYFNNKGKNLYYNEKLFHTIRHSYTVKYSVANLLEKKTFKVEWIYCSTWY